MNNYINKLYWIWTDNFFRYLRIKTYIYENEEIYESINNNIIINNSFNNISGLFNDNFIQYKQRDEYTRRALLILSNEQSLKKFIRKHVPKRKIKFFLNKYVYIIHIFFYCILLIIYYMVEIRRKKKKKKYIIKYI